MSIPGIVQGAKCCNLRVDKDYVIVWNPVSASPTITQYNIYRSEVSYTGFSLIGTVTATVLSYRDETIPYSFDKPWYFKVTATNTEGESPILATPAWTDYDYLVFNRTPVEMDYRTREIDWIENETPEGAINGTNTTFYTLYQFQPRSLQVYISGLKLLGAEFAETTPNSFTLFVTPTIADSLSVSYVKF